MSSNVIIKLIRQKNSTHFQDGTVQLHTVDEINSNRMQIEDKAKANNTAAVSTVTLTACIDCVRRNKKVCLRFQTTLDLFQGGVSTFWSFQHVRNRAFLNDRYQWGGHKGWQELFNWRKRNCFAVKTCGKSFLCLRCRNNMSMVCACIHKLVLSCAHLAVIHFGCDWWFVCLNVDSAGVPGRT